MGNSFALIILIMFSLVGCASRPCWGKKASELEQKVFISKPDGSKQCEKNTGMTPEEMSAQLKGIDIFSMEKRSDGQMHMTVCGGTTGQENVYEIKKEDLSKAIGFGFKELNKNDN